MQEHKEKAIPGFDPFLMGDNFQRFLKSIDPVVMLYEYVFSVVMLENTKETIFFLNLATLVILFYE